jgi:hypothetical protein
VVERGDESKFTSGDHWAGIAVVVVSQTVSTTSNDHEQTADDDDKMVKDWVRLINER